MPEVTCKFGFKVQSEVGQRLTVLSGEHSGHSKYPLTATQDMDITKWSILKSY